LSRRETSCWSEGPVDVGQDHFELRYGSVNEGKSWADMVPVALVGRVAEREFVVQFLIVEDKGGNSAILAAVRRELDFYLIEERIAGPWEYAQYHCGTASNLYSSVHWSFVRVKSPGDANRDGTV